MNFILPKHLLGTHLFMFLRTKKAAPGTGTTGYLILRLFTERPLYRYIIFFLIVVPINLPAPV